MSRKYTRKVLWAEREDTIKREAEARHAIHERNQLWHKYRALKQILLSNIESIDPELNQKIMEIIT